MKTLVIGDIHGCYQELMDLLDAAGPGAGDQVISLGDIIDRGPDTPAVVRFFRTTAGARVVMGSHERKHVRSFDGTVPPSRSQRISRQQVGEVDHPDAVNRKRTSRVL